MVQAQNDIQPEVEITPTNDSGEYTFFQPAPKIKRTRKPWVYRSEYEKLLDKKNNITALAYIGWLLFLFYITFDALT